MAMELSKAPAVAVAEKHELPRSAPGVVPKTSLLGLADESKPMARPALRWDAVLVFLVMLSAFFLASFPVRNSDFWLHLGTGKALLSGQSSMGAEPFLYTQAE